MLTGMKCNLHPSSALFGLGYTPDYVVYHELVLTSKEYMQCVTAVDPEWLAELGPMFFSIKESYQSVVDKRLKERAHEKAVKQIKQEEKEQKQPEKREVRKRVRQNLTFLLCQDSRSRPHLSLYVP